MRRSLLPTDSLGSPSLLAWNECTVHLEVLSIIENFSWCFQKKRFLAPGLLSVNALRVALPFAAKGYLLDWRIFLT